MNYNVGAFQKNKINKITQDIKKGTDISDYACGENHRYIQCEGDIKQD